MSSCGVPRPNRRAFLASCAAPLSIAWWPQDQAAQPKVSISWQRAVDAYLAGELHVAARVLELAPDVMAEEARIALGAWAGDAADHRADERRRAVRRLQAAAAIDLEIPQPLSAQARSGSALLLESVAATAIKILKSRELPGMAMPADRDGRPPEAVRRRMAAFRGRWHVACLQRLVNDRRLVEAGAIADEIALPDGDRALPEAHYLRGLLCETRTRLLPTPRIQREDELRPPSRLPWINGQLGDAAGWYRRALAASPTHWEARLHLGRVELERGRHLRAVEVLQPLRELQASTWIVSLAWLFTGEAYVALGSLDEAGHAFRRASDTPDVWQSARVALMQLALRRGDLSGAADMSTEFAAPRASHGNSLPDAWWTYVWAPRPDHTAVLEPMREAILT